MSSPHKPSGAEAAMLYNYVRTVVGHDLASGVIRPPTGIALIMDHRQVLGLHEEWGLLGMLPLVDPFDISMTF